MQIFMIVDDSPVICKVANRLLSDMGFVVVQAEDGTEGLSLSSHNMPDIIMVDWDLPSMSGVEFIQEFRRLPGADQTKVLFCSSEMVISEMTKAKRAGADGFVMKPFNRAILESKFADIGIEFLAKAA